MKLKPLIYRSLEELEKQINTRQLLVTNTNDDGHELYTRFDNIHTTLKADIDKGDQEKNYLNYRKLFILLEKIKKTELFRTDKIYSDMMLIDSEKTKDYMERCKRLRDELIKRYDSNKVLNFKSALANESNAASSLNTQTDHLTCIKLNELLEQLNKSKQYVLLIDLRRREDFEKSSIRLDDKLASCLMTINIPEDRIQPGCTCQSIEAVLTPNDLIHFRNRNQAHTVVLMDYESSSLKSNDKLFIFHQALSKVSSDLLPTFSPETGGHCFSCSSPSPPKSLTSPARTVWRRSQFF